MNHRPNVVIFFTDQQRFDSTGLHGNPLDLTPNLDRLAQRGTHLAQAFTPQPVCTPARACLQTGTYATTTGVYRNGVPLPTDVPTVARCFGQAGYRTGYIGKWHLSCDTGRGAVPAERRAGYRDWLGIESLEYHTRPYHTFLFDDDNRKVFLPGYRVDALTDAAIRYVHQHRAEPFCLMVSHIEPHEQNDLGAFVAPDGYRERYTGRWTPPDLAALVPDSPRCRGQVGGTAAQSLGSYWGSVRRIDEAFGRLLEALKSLGLADDTIVLFTSDHGDTFHTRNHHDKCAIHDAAARIPAVIAGPGFDGGGRLEHLVSLVDVAPTLLHACGIEPPASMQGRSFLPLIHDRSAPWSDDVFIQVSQTEVGRAVRTRRWKYAVKAPDHHPVEDPSADRYVESYLYDLEYDPYELCNLAGMETHAEVARIMRERLVRRMAQAGERPAEIVPAPPRKGGQRRVLPEELPPLPAPQPPTAAPSAQRGIPA